MKALKNKSLIALFICAVTILSGCTVGENAENYKDNMGKAQSRCEAFNKAVEGKDPTMAAIKVINECKGDLKENTVTRYVLRYEKLLLEEKSEFSNKIFNRGNHEVLYDFFPESFAPERIDEIEDPEFRSIMRDLVNSGYTLEKSEKGIYQVVIDYDFFKQYSEYVDQEVSGYFELMKLEQINPLIGSDGLLGSAEDVMNRLILFDTYIYNNPKSERLKELNDIANSYLLSLVFGYEDDQPYDDDDLIKPEYYDVYVHLSTYNKPTLMNDLMSGIVEALNTSDKYWNEDVYEYIIEYPEIYRKRYLNSVDYPDGFVDVEFGWTSDGYFYYYPVFSGITDLSEEGKLNLMSKSVVEKRMLGEGFDGMYTGGNYIWSDYQLTFNRRNWISLKYDIYIEQPDGTYFWTVETMNYDLHNKRKIKLRDVLRVDEERAYINETVKAFFEESRTYYAVSLEEFYKNPSPEFYLTNTGIYFLVPVNPNTEATERIVEIFIPFEKFRSSVEYIYKIPQREVQ